MSNKWVYLFDEVDQAEKYVGGEWENVRGLLGGKGANLAEMASMGIPVPAFSSALPSSVRPMLMPQPPQLVLPGRSRQVSWLCTWGAVAAMSALLVRFDTNPHRLARLGALLDEVAGRAAIPAAHAEQAMALAVRGADLLILETFFRLDELQLAVEAVRGVTDLPLIAMMTFAHERPPHPYREQAAMVDELAELDLVAVGVNCAPGPTGAIEILRNMRQQCVPLAASPARLRNVARIGIPSMDPAATRVAPAPSSASVAPNDRVCRLKPLWYRPASWRTGPCNWKNASSTSTTASSAPQRSCSKRA